MRALQIAVILSFLLMFGCEPKEEQPSVESAIAHELASMLKARDFASATRLTNFPQLFAEHHPGRPFYPYVWDKRLRQFGNTAGFSNSFYEKYVVVPLGATSEFLRGDPTLMSAQPFPDRSGRPTRIVISKLGMEHEKYRIHSLPETNVLDIFAQAKIPVPKPTVFSPPPPPSPEEQRRLNARPSYSASDWVRIICGRIANKIGMTEGHWPTVLFLMIMCLIIVVVAVWLFCHSKRCLMSRVRAQK